MPAKKKPRNKRIVRLHDEAGLSFTAIAKRLLIEFPDDPPISRQAVRTIYEREAKGIKPLAGAAWYKAKEAKK